MGLKDEKTKDRKSRDSVPLTTQIWGPPNEQ
jgi:hypothetical protein